MAEPEHAVLLVAATVAAAVAGHHAALRAHVDAALQTRLGVKIELPTKFPFEGGY